MIKIQKKGARDTYTRRPACAILYMCIPQKSIAEATIPTNQKSFRQKILIVNATGENLSGLSKKHPGMFVRIPTVMVHRFDRRFRAC